MPIRYCACASPYALYWKKVLVTVVRRIRPVYTHLRIGRLCRVPLLSTVCAPILSVSISQTELNPPISSEYPSIANTSHLYRLFLENLKNLQIHQSLSFYRLVNDLVQFYYRH